MIFGNHVRICLKTEKNREKLCQDGRSHDLQDFTLTSPSSRSNRRNRSPSSLTRVPAALFSKIKRHLNSNALIITLDFLRNKPHKDNFRKRLYETESSSFSNVSKSGYLPASETTTFCTTQIVHLILLYGNIRFLFSQPKYSPKQILRKKYLVILI